MARARSPRWLLLVLASPLLLTSCGGDPRPQIVDAGPDAALDAGPDAGLDADAPPMLDAGPDAGTDAGADAGMDAGVDAGMDAGPGCLEGAMLTCAVDAGTCSDGWTTCTGGSFGACVPDVVPTAELCNGLDEDCDGVPDDDFPTLGDACDGADDDLCATGMVVCSGDELSVVCTDDATSEVELCNGVDDDCDTVADEGFGLGAPCDGADDDLCGDGTRVCSADGSTWECADDPASFAELCNDFDDDCDGALDEDFPTLGDACDGADDDLCATGTVVCSGDELSVECDDDPASVVEVCNGVDDDCDGATDEGFVGLGDACDGADDDLCATGTLGCSGDGLSVVCSDDAASAVETCNQLDDDCDLEADEGLHGVWSTQPIDATDHAFEYPAIAIAADGTRHVIYNDAEPGWGDLRHAEAAPGGSFAVTYLDAVGDTGRYPSLAIDSSGTLHAAYYDQSTKLRYATRSGAGAWSPTTVVMDACWSTALAVDSADGVHLGCYWWFVGGGVVSWRTHAAGSPTFGSPETPYSTGNSDRGIGLVIDSSDRPHMTFYDDTTGDLRYMVRTGVGTWPVEDVETAGDVGQYGTLAIDSADGLHAAYYDATNGDLRYAYRPAAGSWSALPIDATGDVGRYAAIAVDGDDVVHILYASATGALTWAHGPAGGPFTTEPVGGVQVRFVAVAVDAAGGLHVAYRQQATPPVLAADSLQYAHRCP